VVDWTTATASVRWNFLVPDAGYNRPFTSGYTKRVGLTLARWMLVDWPIKSFKSSELPPPTYLNMDGITLTEGDKASLAAMYESCIRTLPAEIRAGLGYDMPVLVEMGFDYWGYPSLESTTPVHRVVDYSQAYYINGFSATVAEF
jgi:hypothetical protein